MHNLSVDPELGLFRYCNKLENLSQPAQANVFS